MFKPQCVNFSWALNEGDLQNLDGINLPKAVFIAVSPLSERDAKRFGLEIIEAAGIPTQVWDLSHFYFPEAAQLSIETPNWVELSICSSVDEVRALCESLTSEHIVIFIGGLNPEHTWQGRRLLRLVSATPALLATISSGHLPPTLQSDARTPNLRVRAKRFIALLRHPHRWRHIYRRLAIAVFGPTIVFRRKFGIGGAIRPLDRVWAGTRVGGLARCHIGSVTKVTYVHTLDYDLVLELRSRDAPVSPYVLFIDQMGPLHPDMLLRGEPYGISMETYSAMVCRGLARVEDHLGIKAVVAVHPRADPGTMEPWYQGRTLIYGDTAQLIVNAEVVVIADASTSIGLAAVFRRPVVLMTSASFDLESQTYTHALAHYLQTDFLDLDGAEFPALSLEVDEDAYTRYVEQYIKQPSTPQLPFWSVVASEILSDGARVGDSD